MELQVGVKILLRNQENRFLLLRRSPKKYPEAGATWDIVGGRINPGSPLVRNLIREIKEETGLDFSGTPKLIAAQDILKVPGRHVVRLTYCGTIEGDPVLNDDHTEFCWCTIDEMKHLDMLDEYLRELLDGGIISAL